MKQQPTLPEGPSNPRRLLLAAVLTITIESPQAQTEANSVMPEIVENPLELTYFQLPPAVENRFPRMMRKFCAVACFQVYG
jgi:hypothetical protein